MQPGNWNSLKPSFNSFRCGSKGGGHKRPFKANNYQTLVTSCQLFRSQRCAQNRFCKAHSERTGCSLNFQHPPPFLPGLCGSPVTQNKGHAVIAVRLGPRVTKMLLEGAYWVQTVPVDTNVPFNKSKGPCLLVERGFLPGNIGP